MTRPVLPRRVVQVYMSKYVLHFRGSEMDREVQAAMLQHAYHSGGPCAVHTWVGLSVPPQ